MKIVSVINQKGGVAKTTTCANLGACLAAKGKQTLLIDLDPQANLSLGLHASSKDLPYGLAETLVDSYYAPLSGVIRLAGALPLYIAPGSVELAKAEARLARTPRSGTHLKNAIDALNASPPFDWVLIDCPPSLGMLTQNAVIASTHLLVPTEAKMYAFSGMDTLNGMIAGLAQEYRFQAELLGVLITNYEKGTKLHRMIAGHIRERFGARVFDTVIAKNVRLSEAEVEGKPIIQFDHNATGSKNYRELAEEVLRRVGDESEQV